VYAGRPRPLLTAGLVAAVALGVLAATALALRPGTGPGEGAPAGPGAPGAAAPGPHPGAGATVAPPLAIPPGFPDATTTGVPDGVTLRRTGMITVRENGAVLENLLVVDGAIEVYANDVTIRNVRITNDREMVQWGIAQRDGFGGLVVEDTEIFGNPSSSQKLASGISNHGGMITVRRVEIHTITDGIVTSHGLIEDSYLHSPRLFDGDHTDMVQAIGGSSAGLPLVIRRNTIINTENQTGAVFLSDETGSGQVPVRDVTVEGNLLAGGGYTFYGGGLVADGRDPRGIVVVGNVFSRAVWPDGGWYGPVAYFDPSAPGNRWQDNTWDDGAPLDLD
jgi:hypothetical protein